MSLTSPSDILVKLEELRKWQERQQKRLLEDHNKRLQNTSSSVNEAEFERKQISELENDKPKRTGTATTVTKNEIRAEDLGKPKQPFLRRGAGLARFRMTPGQQFKPSVPQSKVAEKSRPKSSTTEVKKRQEKPVRSKSVTFVSPKAEPLRQSAINIQLARAAWDSARNSENRNLPPIDNAKANKIELAPVTVSSSEPEEETHFPALIEEYHDKGNETLASERELVLFETLEKKVTQNSFCSTNSSILKFLSSTPHKIPTKHNSMEEEIVSSDDQTPHIEEIEEDMDGIRILEDNDKLIENNAQQFKKIEAYEQKLQEDYLSLIEKAIKLKEFVVGERESDSTSSLVSAEEVLEDNTLQNFDDESRWSDSESVRSQDSSSTLSSIKSSNHQQCLKCDAETMTDFVDHEQLNIEKELKRLRAENLKMTKMKNELEQEKREFEKYKKEIVKMADDEKVRVNLVLQDERKKIAKEKMVFEQYVKDLQNKPSKKEREEISALKSKIATLEETLKLKETRNGTTQARLRNQIKTLEKKTAELQKEVENLTKQNAKLTATQNNRKLPSDTKILHQINKNLSKLAQEQLEKLTTPNDLQSEKKSGVKKVLSRSQETKEKENIKNVENVEDFTNFSSSIEEFYEKTFGKTNSINDRTLSRRKSYENEKMDERSCKSEEKAERDSRKSDRTEILLDDGSKQVEYRNGNVKVTSADGNMITFKYYNGDFKETNLLKGTVKYYYHNSQVNHITNADGTELIEYPDGQREKRHKDGKCEVEYPNGTRRVMSADIEEISYPDGTVVCIHKNGDRIITLLNGQREIHTNEFKRREYPDGTVKVLYPDGLQETRYANGRTRLKDKDGKLLMDSEDTKT